MQTGSFDNVGERLLAEAKQQIKQQKRSVGPRPKKGGKQKQPLDEREVAAPPFNLWAYAAFFADRSGFEVGFCDTSVLSTLVPAAPDVPGPVSAAAASDMQLCGPIAVLFAAILAATPEDERDPERIAHALVAHAAAVAAASAEPDGDHSLSAPGMFAWYVALGAWQVWPAVLISACTLQPATSEAVADQEQMRADRVWATVANTLSQAQPASNSLECIKVCTHVYSISKVHYNKNGKLKQYNCGSRNRYVAAGGAPSRDFVPGLVIALMQFPVGRGSCSTADQRDHCAVFFKIHRRRSGGCVPSSVCVVWDPLAGASNTSHAVMEELAPGKATLVQFVGKQTVGESTCVHSSIDTIIKLVEWVSNADNAGVLDQATSARDIARACFGCEGTELVRTKKRHR